MLDFAQLILHKINSYKKIVKKHLPAKEYTAKIGAHGLKGKKLKKNNEVFLFNLAHNLLADLEYLVANKIESADFYSGVDEFITHLKEILVEYRVHGEEVVHISREASRSLVEAVQLIALPATRLDAKIAMQLKSCGYVVAKYGTGEQVRIFFNALKKHETKAQEFFYHLLEDFKSHVTSRIADDAR